MKICTASFNGAVYFCAKNYLQKLLSQSSFDINGFVDKDTESIFTLYRKYKVATVITAQNLAQLEGNSPKMKFRETGYLAGVQVLKINSSRQNIGKFEFLGPMKSVRECLYMLYFGEDRL